AFFDSDADGIGDFPGLTQKLDYLQDLGVTALWLLPFYPSPLRDEGYDTSDYRGIHPAYGTLRQFRRFLDEAHRRGLRVITELALNHTSDQHPWFQRARRSPAGSRARDWYVWSDDPNKYRDARVIFRDFEHSNWAWDPVANSYYWHRFYSHQPDLNYDNPEVRREMLRTVEYWLDMGVDGLRLDAVPYLFEREDTSCENLPETHEFLKELRRYVDERFDARLLLAEANQWPEDAVEYFGKGDECHMAFHFPVMPRLFMGLRMEDRFPISDILRQTPEPPDGCQWAVFLRNHDELTLEMVTDEERDYMYRAYAHDPQMRINLGIRRRLAPLLHNHRQKVELMHGLLCSLPGTPVLYYGDEIGMGDNVYLGDRDGVRTPMQWSADRNAGFSTCNPQRLFLPAVIDPEYHYETVNVEAQLDNPDSLLWWVRRLIALRKRHRVFGRGSVELLTPDNHRVLAFLRRAETTAADGENPTDRTVLVVANLSRFAQYVELDLSEFRGRRPVELFGHTTFPAIGDLPYLLTLGPHAFYWLALEPVRADATMTDAKGMPSLATTGPWTALFERRSRRPFEAMLPRLLRTRRWFGAKSRTVTGAHIDDAFTLPLPHSWPGDEEAAPEPAIVLFVRVEYLDGEPETYVLPVTFLAGAAGQRLIEDQPAAALAIIRPTEGETGLLVDAHWVPGFGTALAQLLGRRRQLRGEYGSIVGAPSASGSEYAARTVTEAAPATVLRGEQTNTSLLFGERMIMKTLRRVEPGENPELEMSRVLTDEVRYANAPTFVGALVYRRERNPDATLAVAHRFVPHESDAWSWFLEFVGRYFDEMLSHPDASLDIELAHPLDLVRQPSDALEGLTPGVLVAAELLGRRVGELHRALASARAAAFVPEPASGLSQRSTYQSMRTTASRAMRALERASGSLSEAAAADTREVLSRQELLYERLRALLSVRGGQRIRVHGDLHLGQVLSTGNDFVILDFEGEPARTLSERRLKRSPLRDVAGMLRSFHYAAYTAIPEAVERGQVREEQRRELLEDAAERWVARVSASFLTGYLEAVDGSDLLPRDDHALRVSLDAHLLEKACYEIQYELDHRPDFVEVPIAGVRRLLLTNDTIDPGDSSR
ncbi:MAG: maltose alpha-D-glucosyltransferase / alpha-amylase, partial [Actinomycetota bacterium]|nr:maltose alpha-D-glucosyltransferase / alpha-amylase [Actinomycetota bacterium]